MGRSSRAQSESVGVLLLTGVVVVLVGTLGLYLIGAFVADAESDPLVDVSVNATTQFVSVEHAGGETRPTAGLTVIVDGEQRREYALASFDQRRGDDEARFAPGDSWRGPNEVAGDRLEVTVVDESANAILDSETVTVRETIAARFSYDPDAPVAEEQITFDASASSVRGSTLDSYEWDFDGDGTTDATGEAVDHAIDRTGTHVVELVVTAADGRSTSATREVRVYDAGPTAEFSFSPSTPTTRDDVTFDGTASSGGDEPIVSYSWTFGDGATATGEKVTHSYDSDGTYDVTLTVTTESGTIASSTETVSVGNVPPVVELATSDDAVHTQEPVEFDASGSTDPDGTVEEYRWDFDDGNETVTTDATVTHRFESPGRYTVNVTAVDDDGASNGTDTTIVVGGLRPVDSTTTSGTGTDSIVYANVTNNASTAFDVTAVTIRDDLSPSTQLREACLSDSSYGDRYEVLVDGNLDDGFVHPPDGRAAGFEIEFFGCRLVESFPHGERISLESEVVADRATVAPGVDVSTVLVEFQDAGDDPVDMRGRAVTITYEIEYADGITDQETITVEPR